MNYLANVTRPVGDPVIRSSGPSSLGASDRLAQALGWFSIGLGAAELLAPKAMARTLGMRGMHGLLCSYGAREIGAGVLALSIDRQAGLWGRLAGDVLDVATLARASRPANPRLRAVRFALATLTAVTLLDLYAALTVTARHRRGSETRRYADRSGFPRGLQAAREAAAARGTAPAQAD